MKTGRIYKLYNQYGVYYGSTIQTLKARFAVHKCGAKTKKCTSKILFKDGCIPKIELLEEVEFDDIKELREREGYYIRNLDCVNKDIPGRTDKEYRIDNRDKKLEYQKEYYLDNKDKKKEYQKKYNEVNKKNISEKKRVKMTCECGSVVRKTDIQRHYKSKKHLKYIETNNI